jgi:hypothetical protein
MVDLRTLEKQSIQEHEPPTSFGSGFWYALPANDPKDEVLLPDWGLHERDRQLRLLYRNQFNWIAQSAVAALTRKFTQTPWQLKGGRNLTNYYQQMLQDADFGDGWSDMWAQVLLDYLTCDYGAFIEVIGAGAADGEIRGRVTGIAHLDSLRCIPTGNLEFPVVYWSRRTGKLHRIHHTRIIRLVDMRDGDELRFGAGMCSLSRAVAIIQQQMPMMRYIAGQLSDVPANGVVFLEGITGPKYYEAVDDYNRRRAGGYKGEMAIGGHNSAQGIKGTRLPFAVAPEGFDYSMYVDIAVNAFSAAFGIDRQDLWPLQGRMSGTATQSEILAAKAMGMAFGDLLSKVKRAINTRVLPPALEFDFEYRNEEKDKQVAERTSILLNNASMLRGLGATDEVVMRYLAQQDETLRDVLLDKNGEIIALPDDDVVPDDQTGAVPDEDAIANDDESEEAPAEDAQVATDGQNEKDVTDNQTAFIQRFNALLESARDGSMNRTRAGLLIRGLIRTMGGRVYGDGMEEGGVPRERMDANDNAEIARLVAAQSQYVGNLTDVLFNQDGISDAQAAGKAVMWFNKSINPFYDAGRMSANANGMYEFKVGNTEHCPDCLMLNGQIHRLKEFIQSGWHPKSSRLKCKGYRCECELVKRRGASARGQLPSGSKVIHVHQMPHAA